MLFECICLVMTFTLCIVLNMICRALDSNEYSNLTATYYLLAEKRLKRIHAADVKASPSIKSRPVESTAWPHRLEHSISTPDDSIFYGSTRYTNSFKRPAAIRQL